ncbi:hypothetical protein R3P38DRAFT_2760800 [Favolaschia claudopus]|uniref:Anaphase-promoting complex subunit 1 n=1 Tax=Favolaschia claudopus TaxID=2862362 RepID=A0AAW0DVG4_9AGAR
MSGHRGTYSFTQIFNPSITAAPPHAIQALGRLGKHELLRIGEGRGREALIAYTAQAMVHGVGIIAPGDLQANYRPRQKWEECIAQDKGMLDQLGNQLGLLSADYYNVPLSCIVLSLIYAIADFGEHNDKAVEWLIPLLAPAMCIQKHLNLKPFHDSCPVSGRSAVKQILDILATAQPIPGASALSPYSAPSGPPVMLPTSFVRSSLQVMYPQSLHPPPAIPAHDSLLGSLIPPDTGNSAGITLTSFSFRRAGRTWEAKANSDGLDVQTQACGMYTDAGEEHPQGIVNDKLRHRHLRMDDIVSEEEQYPRSEERIATIWLISEKECYVHTERLRLRRVSLVSYTGSTLRVGKMRVYRQSAPTEELLLERLCPCVDDEVVASASLGLMQSGETDQENTGELLQEVGIRMK